MKRRLLPLACALVFLLGIAPPELCAAPRVPVDDAEVLVRLNPSLSRADAAEIRRLRASRQPTGQTQDESLTLVRQLIQLARNEADPRFLHQAQSLLKPWLSQDTTQPNTRIADGPTALIAEARVVRAPEVLLLQATIRQSLHDFDGALSDLDEVLRVDPQHGPAWLTRAVIQTVTGDYAAARESCLQAMRFADPLAAATATAALGGALGRSDSAYATLARALESEGLVDPSTTPERKEIRAWAWVTLGELAERRDLPELALEHYESALALAPRNPSTLAAQADVLLELNRPAAVIDSLNGFQHIDALLLRLAEATAQRASEDSVQAPELGRLTGQLRARFEAGRLRGESLHLREEARFELRLNGNPERALELARLNWETQREWADTRLLIEAAQAAGDQQLVRDTRDFLANPLAQPERQTANHFTP